ncbi:SDR family NAD(P)-dependent oxidoreductase [Paenibacillus mesophilus]|uniref:SDR family NAD(P)-dependent oxidoreductase n=1 Tax=Paenibacillus mesophilus TaxID=2582849 RepID=UPI00110EAF45|nr:SDR family NAD(P)-dependent oxidoreductase [Paenibacillus mesophilus]TMV50737.1 SDR family NAD(P)-dependent oxidoreductase [Paenibacillus mesophilus]
MKRAIVLGAAGGMGRELVKELLGRGIETVAFGRSKEKLERLADTCGNDPLLTVAAGDAMRPEDIARAAVGADVVYHSMGIPYPEWGDKLLPLAASVMRGAKEAGAKTVVIDNIYAYGKIAASPATEQHPKRPHTRKGKLRLEMERVIMDAHRDGARALIARLPDFYGPDVPNSMLHVTLDAIAKRKSAMFVGKLDIPREYVYLPDAAKAVVELSINDDAYGEIWHIPGADTITGAELVRIAQAEAGQAKPVRSIGRKTFAILGLFNPFMREVREMLYLTEEPFVLSGAKYLERIGPLPATPYERGIRETVRAHMAASGRR